MLLLLGCDDTPVHKVSPHPWLARTNEASGPTSATPVDLATLTPQVAEEMKWSDKAVTCVPTWEGKGRQTIPSHLRSSPIRSLDSKESSSVYFEYLILPGCLDHGARRAAIFERPAPSPRFELPSSQKRRIVDRERGSAFFKRLELLWREATKVADGPVPEVSAQSTIIHYSARNLFSFTFSIDRLEPQFETELHSHTLFRDTGQDVRFADLFSEQSKSQILHHLNQRLSEQIEERNRGLVAEIPDGTPVFDLLHQSPSGSERCRLSDEEPCIPTRFHPEDLDHFIVHPLGIVFYHDFGLRQADDAKTPLSEVLLPFHVLKQYFSSSSPFDGWGTKVNAPLGSRGATHSL